MFVRFVVDRIHPDSGRRTGIFQAAYQLRHSGSMTGYEHDRLAAALSWFNKNLDKPARLSWSSRPNRKAQAICWFKAGAAEHLARIREIQHILAQNGIVVEMITTRRPGYVVYEDDYQLAAYPFNDTVA